LDDVLRFHWCRSGGPDIMIDVSRWQQEQRYFIRVRRADPMVSMKKVDEINPL
jgi:hypothetical protein